jgi:hypothetical protein
MMAAPPPFNPFLFGPEIIFTVVAVAFCAAIYLKTKETYDLTKYEGILYFRDAFLFFGLAYLMRFLFSAALVSTIALDLFLPRDLVAPLFIVPLGYFSTVAIFYLIFSSVWKRFDNKRMLILGHSLALILTVISFVTRSHETLFLLQAALLVIALIAVFAATKTGKRLSQTKVLYLLVFLLWLLSLWFLGARRPFPPEMESFFYAVSLVVFITIYYRVTKWVH